MTLLSAASNSVFAGYRRSNRLLETVAFPGVFKTGLHRKLSEFFIPLSFRYLGLNSP